MGITEPLAAFRRSSLQWPWVREEGASLADIEREEEELTLWARSAGMFLSFADLEAIRASARLAARGNEHDVLFTREGVLRFTNGDKYGMHFRTPSDYFRRWHRSNQLFPQAAVEFAGFYLKPNGNGVIVTRQPFIAGRKGTDREISEVFAKLGFQPIGRHSFRHLETSIEIHDAHADNVIFDKNGRILPFDVWVDDPAGVLERIQGPESGRE